jgi:hypothetical protein
MTANLKTEQSFNKKTQSQQPPHFFQPKKKSTNQLRALVNSLFTENMDLKRRISLTEEKLVSIERLIQDLKKQIPD